MNRVMGYADRWSVAPGDTLSFKVSCLGGDQFSALIVRLKQPEAGPLATPFAPEPVDAPCNGTHSGRLQSIPIGSLAVVPAHPALDFSNGATLACYVMPTTPAKGRQAIMGNWNEATQTGIGLEISDAGTLILRIGAGPGKVTVIDSATKFSAQRWYRIGASYDAQAGTATIWQEPLSRHEFHPEIAVTRSVPAPLAPPGAGPFTFAAWNAGPTTAPSAWGGLAFSRHMNGRIDRPRLARGPSDRARLLTLLADSPEELLDNTLIAVWNFASDMGTDDITDRGPNRLHGVIVNQPTRAMRGHNWNGTITDWTRDPSQYGAIHFHDDDLVDACWDTDFTFTIPDTLRSGVYAARLTSSDGFDFWVPFFVRPKRGTATSKVAFLASTATYTVYMNNRGRFMSLVTERYQGRLALIDGIDELLIEFPEMGLSTYDRHSDGSGVAYSSRLRPVQNVRPTGRHWNFNIDLFLVDWLEHLGGDYDVITEEDLHREGLDLLKPYRVILTGSHPEYDSVEMLDALEAWLRQGGRLMYMGGNGFYWRIAHHPARDGVLEVRRAEGGVRAWDAEPGEYHMAFSGEYGGLWRRNARAPQRLAGVGFISQGFDHCSYFRRQDAANDPRAAWIFDGVPDELVGNFGILQGGAAGLEIDAADAKLGTPPHALVLARSENHSNTYELVAEEVLIPHGATDAIINPDIHADMVFFETPGGGAVFSTGSIAYMGSLAWNKFDNNIARLTANVLNRFKDPAPFPMPSAPNS